MNSIIKDGYADISNTLNHQDDWFGGDDIFSNTDTSQPYIVGVPSGGVIGGLPGIGFNGEMYSVEGYKRNSKDVNRPYNVIPSGRITMKDVEFPVLGIDNKGNSRMMKPGGEYKFPGNRVLEVPFKRKLWF